MESITPGSDIKIRSLHALLDDIQLVNGTKNTECDKNYVTKRYNQEGLSFLTVTLPLLGSALDSALRSGSFNCPQNFKRYRRSALPAFTHGLLLRIFNLDGSLVLKPDLAAISELRQIYYMFYKYVTDFSKRQLAAAEEKFKSTDASLPDINNIDFSSEIGSVLKLAKGFVKTLFADFDPFSGTPVHGPGIVATGEKPHEKRLFTVKYRRVHEQWPYYRWLYVNATHLLDCVRTYRARTVEEVGTNKVLFVPKDSRGPRTIACEPLVYQFLQGGLRRSLYEYIESHSLTKGRINFTDQGINQQLAYQSSKTGRHATVDMKDASDRVSNSLVEYLFEDTKLLKPMQALRTPFSLLPSGEVVPLKKFAAMGSALCFPIEAVVFFSIIRAVQLYYDLDTSLYVYGDDIICDPRVIDFVLPIFDAIGLVINLKKTSSTGLFRESCGSEFYDGHDISYIKCRTLDVTDPGNAVSVVSFCNLIFDRGYYNLSRVLESHIRKNKALKHIPTGYKDSPYICLYSTRGDNPNHFKVSNLKWDKRYQYFKRCVPTLQGTSYDVESNNIDEEYAEYYRKVTQGWHPWFVPGSYVKRKVKLVWRWVQVNL